MLYLIQQIGAAFMWLFNIKEVKAVIPEIKPSAGCTFINFDEHDPEHFLRMHSENYEAPQ